MVLDVPVKELISEIGDKELYHLQEAYDLAFKRGYFVMPFERRWDLHDGKGGVTRLHVPPQWWRIMLCGRPGFITGWTQSEQGHCVAWDGSKIYDPLGTIYDIRFTKNYNFRPDTFHWVGSKV